MQCFSIIVLDKGIISIQVIVGLIISMVYFVKTNAIYFLKERCCQICAEYSSSLLLQSPVHQWIVNSAIPGASHVFLHYNFTLHISTRVCIRVRSPSYINY